MNYGIGFVALLDLCTMVIDCLVSVDKELNAMLSWQQYMTVWVCTQSHSHYYMNTLVSGTCGGTVSLDR